MSALVVILPVALTSTLLPNNAVALTPTDYLGSAVGFAVLASTPSITSTGITTISGSAGSKMGISPAASVTDAGKP